jgi:hypothetical protein
MARKSSSRARRVSNWCFGVSMLGRWMNAGPEVNRLETPYCVRTCQVVSARVRGIGRHRQRPGRKNNPPKVSAVRRRSSAHRFAGQPEDDTGAAGKKSNLGYSKCV